MLMAKNRQRYGTKESLSSSVHLFIYWWNIPLRRGFGTSNALMGEGRGTVLPHPVMIPRFLKEVKQP